MLCSPQKKVQSPYKIYTRNKSITYVKHTEPITNTPHSPLKYTVTNTKYTLRYTTFKCVVRMLMRIYVPCLFWFRKNPWTCSTMCEGFEDSKKQLCLLLM